MWHVKQQAVQVQCTFPVCHWNKQLVLDCHWRNTLHQYYIQVWYIFMRRILFGDVFEFYKFLFWLSVYLYNKVLKNCCITNFRIFILMPSRIGSVNYRISLLTNQQYIFCQPLLTSSNKENEKQYKEALKRLNKDLPRVKCDF